MKYLPGSKSMDVAARQQAPELRDYFDVLRRRKRQLFWPFALLVALSVLAAFTLPPVYRAEATIVVENEQIPEKFVSSTVTAPLQERIRTLTQRLQTEENLWPIIEKYDLYREDRKSAPRRAIVGQMREDMLIEPVALDVVDQETGRPIPSIVALTVSFEAEKPATAQQVTNALAARFLEINRRERSEQVEQVTAFLAAEADKMREEIASLEGQLAAFKQENVGQLPDQANLNMQMLEQTQETIRRTEEQIRVLRDQQITLSSQLAITDPNKEVLAEDGSRLLSPTEKLRVLRAELRSIEPRYSSSHPDIIRLKSEIAALEAAAGGGGANELASQLAQARADLSEARRQYSAQHPDVQSLEQKVQDLQEALASADRGEALYPDNTIPDNPTYVTLKSQLDTVVANIESEQQSLAALNEELDKYESRLFSTPEVERDYLALTRDYDNARAKYNELKDQLLEARLAVELETGSQGDRLSLLQAAIEPAAPAFPNRPAFILVGVALGIVGGIGTGSIAEYMDRAVHGARGVINIFHAPPLASIPYIENTADRASRRRRRLLSGLSTAAFIVLLAALIYILWEPISESELVPSEESVVTQPVAPTPSTDSTTEEQQ